MHVAGLSGMSAWGMHAILNEEKKFLSQEQAKETNRDIRT